MRFTQVLCGTASAVVLAGLGAASAAQAQQAASDVQTVDSIVVTAQKREQNLQDVPVVVTAVGAKLLQDTGEFVEARRLTLLRWCTGLNALPICGLDKKVQIRQDGLADARLPNAHTCSNEIEMPDYSSKAVLRMQLKRALDEFECDPGFHQS